MKMKIMALLSLALLTSAFGAPQRKIVCYEVDEKLYQKVRKLATRGQKKQVIQRAIASGSAMKNAKVYKASSCPLPKQKKLTYIKWLELKQKQRSYRASQLKRRSRALASRAVAKKGRRKASRGISSDSATNALLNDDVNPFGDLLFAKNEAGVSDSSGASELYQEEELTKDDFVLGEDNQTATADSNEVISDDTSYESSSAAAGFEESLETETRPSRTSLSETPVELSVGVAVDSLMDPGFAESASLTGAQIGLGYDFQINERFSTMTRPTVSYSTGSGDGENINGVTMWTAKVKQSVYYNMDMSSSIFRPYAGLGIGMGNLTYRESIAASANVPGTNGVSYNLQGEKEGEFGGMIVEAHLGAQWVFKNNLVPFIELGYRNFNGGEETQSLSFEGQNMNANPAVLEADQSGIFGVVGVGYRF